MVIQRVSPNVSTDEVVKEFRVRSKGTWAAFLLCGVLLLLWVVMEVMFVKAWLSGARPISFKENGAILVWTLAGIPLLLWLLWLAFGKERITISKRYLRIRYEIAGFGLPLS